jgi:uroporphyrinogen decarboxylase
MPKNETMTSRARVLKALNHEVPDRLPMDLGGNQTGIHKDAYRNLVKHLGIADEVRIMDAIQQLAKPCEAVLQRLHVDTRYIAAGAAATWKGGIVKVLANHCATIARKARIIQAKPSVSRPQ